MTSLYWFDCLQSCQKKVHLSCHSEVRQSFEDIERYGGSNLAMTLVIHFRGVVQWWCFCLATMHKFALLSQLVFNCFTKQLDKQWHANSNIHFEAKMGLAAGDCRCNGVTQPATFPTGPFRDCRITLHLPYLPCYRCSLLPRHSHDLARHCLNLCATLISLRWPPWFACSQDSLPELIERRDGSKANGIGSFVAL